ncbi:unnamed protein product [Malus baccata var. baccata]
MLCLKISAKPSHLLHSITTVSFSSSASTSTPTPTVDFLHSYINYHTYHAILNRLSRSHAFHPMIDPLLSDLKNSQIQCSEDIFITLIRNFGVLGRPKLAFKAFLDVPNFGVQRSAKALNAFFVHSVLKNCGQRFEVKPNLSTCNILIKALCKKNDVETALKVLDEMPAMGFVSNVMTYTTIIGWYVSRGDMVGWYPDTTTYTGLMDGFVKQRKLVDAIKVMDDMEENKVGANEVTYGVMVEAYCKDKKSCEAVILLSDMIAKRYMPSLALCCKVIDVLCREGKVEDGHELWKKLLKKNCTLDNPILSKLIHYVMTYNMLIAGMCEVGELCEEWRLWNDMVEKGCAPNSFTYSMLIKGFCKIGKPDKGIKILEEMMDKGCLPNKSTYNMLIEGLCDIGAEAEVAEVVSTEMSSGGTNIASWDLYVTRFVGDLDTRESLMDKTLLENVQHILSLEEEEPKHCKN